MCGITGEQRGHAVPPSVGVQYKSNRVGFWRVACTVPTSHLGSIVSSLHCKRVPVSGCMPQDCGLVGASHGTSAKDKGYPGTLTKRGCFGATRCVPPSLQLCALPLGPKLGHRHVLVLLVLYTIHYTLYNKACTLHTSRHAASWYSLVARGSEQDITTAKVILR